MNIVKGAAILAAAALIGLTGTTLLAADRLVLGELCTSTTCGPCRDANLELDDLAIELADVFALIRYHGWWPAPGNDPFYHYNIPENRARFNYYGADYVPHFWIDGTINGGSNYNAWRGYIINEADNWSPLILNITGDYDDDARSGEFTVSIFAEMAPGASNLKLRVALTESEIRYQAPNGLLTHNQTFRDMIPSTTGQSFTISEGETVEFTFDFTAPEPLVTRLCQLVAFVQSDQNKNVLQAAKKNIWDLVPTGIDDDIEMPESFVLHQNYPNPFNAETKIDFSTVGGDVKLEVYDLMGSLVKTLVDGNLEAGVHSIIWDANDIASGIYFYRLSGVDGEHVKRMTLLK